MTHGSAQTGEQHGADAACNAAQSGSTPALVSKLRWLISRFLMRRMVQYPAWSGLRDLPDNSTILQRDDLKKLLQLIDRQYYFSTWDRMGWHDALRAACALYQHTKRSSDVNIALSKENSKLKRELAKLKAGGANAEVSE